MRESVSCVCACIPPSTHTSSFDISKQYLTGKKNVRRGTIHSVVSVTVEVIVMNGAREVFEFRESTLALLFCFKLNP